MEDSLAWLPFLFSIAFFAFFAYRVLKILKTLRDPEALSKAITERLEKTLAQQDLDPAAAHELRLRLREELEKKQGTLRAEHRVVLERVLERVDRDDRMDAIPESTTESHGPDPTFRSDAARDLSRPTPIDAGGGGAALRFAIGLAGVVIVLWLYHTLY